MSVDVGDLLDDAAGTEAERPDLDVLWARGRRQRGLRRGAVAVGVVGVLGVAGMAVSQVVTDRGPAILDQPGDDRRPAPGDVDVPTEEHTLDLPAALASTAAREGAGVVVASFDEGTGVGQVGRTEKQDGPGALAPWGPGPDGFGFVDLTNNAIVLHEVAGEGVRRIDLGRYGYAVPGSLLLHRGSQGTAFVTVASTTDGRGVERLLAIELDTLELVADVEHAAGFSNPSLTYGPASADDHRDPSAPEYLWVQDGGTATWRAVLTAGRDDGNRMTYRPVDAPLSTETPISSSTGAGLVVSPSRVEVVWDRTDRAWTLTQGYVLATHPTYDGLLVAVRHGDGEATSLLRLRGEEVVDVVSVDTGAGSGTDTVRPVFSPDGTLLVLADRADGGVDVVAYPPAAYASSSPFTGTTVGTLRLIDGVPWAIGDCYLSPLTPGTSNAVCAAQRAVENGQNALVEATIDPQGLPDEDGVLLLTELPGKQRPDLTGARWATIGGPLVHLGVKIDGLVYVYEMETDVFRTARNGEFDTGR